LVFWQSFLEVPSYLLSKILGLGVGTQALGSVRIGPVALVKDTIGWLVFRFNKVYGGNARCDDAALDTSGLAGLHNISRTIYGRWDQIFLFV